MLCCRKVKEGQKFNEAIRLNNYYILIISMRVISVK